jgi:hypothetical protein
MPVVFPRPPNIGALVPGREITTEELITAVDDLGRWGADMVRELELLVAELEQPASIGWTTSNVTPTRTLNVSTATLADVANVLATLIEDLKTRGDLEK